MLNIGLFDRAAAHGGRIALVDGHGQFTYRQLLERSAAVAGVLVDRCRALRRDASSPATTPSRIAYLVRPGFEHVAVQWGIWGAGAIGVPLSSAQAPAEWAHAIADSEPNLVVVDAEHAAPMRAAIGGERPGVATTDELANLPGDGLAPAGKWGREWYSAPDNYSRPHFGGRRARGRVDGADALILYTSGTTGKPKGVVLTHANLEAQVQCLVAAWDWRPEDRILHVLPLNHVHGIVNILTCALWAGATCEMLPTFDADATWDAIASGRLTLFMAVPTIYAKLVAAWEGATAERRQAMSNGCHAMRLMVSGSAALPVRVLDRWREISGHVLLERYGMTEIGMALSNPLHGERRAGAVGTPLPGVQVQIVDEHGRDVPPGVAGESKSEGRACSARYWRRPDATAAAFRNGWFRTGDVAVFDNGAYRLLGRQSVDIIKSGGYKISALEIEEVLREHPAIGECAVVGIEDPEWGERVAVAVVPREDAPIELEALRDWARPRLARYKLPSRLLVVRDLPRNAMGKASKPAVKRMFRGSETSPKA